MTIINDNDTLLQFVPNVVETVEGETPLFDKLRPQLEITEQWLKQNIIGEDFMESVANGVGTDMWRAAATAIACDAFRRSVPSLDLILTPNGFGVVSNNNVAPASKERVERLMASLSDQRNKAIASLISFLTKFNTWLTLGPGQWLTSSFFTSPDDVRLAKTVLKNEDGWDAFIELREKAAPIEQAYSEKWLGQALTARLRIVLATDPAGSSDVATLARTVRQLVVDEMLSNRRPVKNLDRLVNFIRNNSTLYPEWQSDPVAELFEEKWRFQNKKEAAGYFF